MTSVTHACCLWRVQATSVSYSDKKAGSTRVCVCVWVCVCVFVWAPCSLNTELPIRGLDSPLRFVLVCPFPCHFSSAVFFFSSLSRFLVSLFPFNFLSLFLLHVLYLVSSSFLTLPCFLSSSLFSTLFSIVSFLLFLFPRLIPLSSLSSSFYTLLRSPSCLVSLFPTSFRSPFPVSSFIYFFFLFPFCLLVSSPLYLHLLFYSILVSLLPSLDLLSYFPFVPCLLYLCCFLISSSSLVLSPPKHTHLLL